MQKNRAGETAQCVKTLAVQARGPEFKSQHPTKPGTVYCWEAEAEDHRESSLALDSERPCLQGTRQRGRGTDQVFWLYIACWHLCSLIPLPSPLTPTSPPNLTRIKKCRNTFRMWASPSQAQQPLTFCLLLDCLLSSLNKVPQVKTEGPSNCFSLETSSSHLVLSFLQSGFFYTHLSFSL